MNLETVIEEQGFTKDDGVFTVVKTGGFPYGFSGFDAIVGVFDEDPANIADLDLIGLIKAQCLPEIQSVDLSTHGGVSLTAVLNSHVNEIITDLEDRRYLGILFQQEEGSEYVIFLTALDGSVDFACSASVDSVIVNIIFNLPPTEMFVRGGMLPQ